MECCKPFGRMQTLHLVFYRIGDKGLPCVLQAYWPFHKHECVKNEFADAIENSEPKFAAWMRKHGKQATLKDDEVDR